MQVKLTDDQKAFYENRSYKMDFHCNNCGREFTKEFAFGQVASKGKCTICGVSDEQLMMPLYYKKD
jgi:ribosomal protein S27E